MESYRDWLRKKHPACWEQYWNYFQRFPSVEAFPNWLETVPASEKIHIKKAARKFRQFLIFSGNREAAKQWGRAAGRPVEEESVSGTVRQRQIATMRAVWAASDLSAKQIGELQLEDAQGLIETYPLCAAALSRWVGLRELCRESEAAARKQRVRAEWVQSRFLFPSPSGGASRLRTPSGRERGLLAEDAVEQEELSGEEVGGWYFGEAFSIKGEIRLFRDLSAAEIAAHARDPAVVYFEGWFRWQQTFWEGPYVCREDAIEG